MALPCMLLVLAGCEDGDKSAAEVCETCPLFEERFDGCRVSSAWQFSTFSTNGGPMEPTVETQGVPRPDGDGCFGRFDFDDSFDAVWVDLAPSTLDQIEAELDFSLGRCEGPWARLELTVQPRRDESFLRFFAEGPRDALVGRLEEVNIAFGEPMAPLAELTRSLATDVVTLPPEQWHHVTFHFDRTTQQLALSVGGAEVADVTLQGSLTDIGSFFLRYQCHSQPLPAATDDPGAEPGTQVVTEQPSTLLLDDVRIRPLSAPVQ